jgi:predicted MFS family arabinose efflux permease
MALFSRHFVILWQGQLVSQLGGQAFLIATSYYTLEATGSASLVATVMMASTIPLAVLSPIGGTFADRHSRRAILVGTDLSRGLAVGALGVYLLLDLASTPHVAAIVAVAFFGGVMEALFAPAVQALIPELVPAHRLSAANSVHQISRQAATLVDQALGGILYVALGAAVLLLFDALSFTYGAAATWLLPRDDQPRRGRASLRSVVREYTSETLACLSCIWERRGMLAVMLVFTCVNFLFMPVFVLLPFYTRSVLGAGPEWYGFLLSAAGAGALIGSLAAGAIAARLATPATFVRVAVSGIAVSLLLLAGASSSWVALGALGAIGALASLINVFVITAFQTGVPSEVRGRVMALVVTSSSAAVPLGMALGGILGELWSESLPMVFAGCAWAIAILGAATWLSTGFGPVFVQRDPGQS